MNCVLSLKEKLSDIGEFTESAEWTRNFASNWKKNKKKQKTEFLLINEAQ